MMLFDPANPGKKRLGCECCKNPWSQEGPACLECVAAPAPHAGLEAANLDVSVSPGANFFRYANGGWMDANPVPKEYPAETDDAKVRDFWASANDEDAIEAAGLGALDGVLAVCDGDDVTKALAELHALGVGAVFSVGEGPDDEQSSWTLLQLGQGGLGLPDRDYYFDDDKKEKLALYETFVAETLGRLGLDAALGPKIVAFEAAAFSFLTRTEMRDPKVVYNKYSPPNSAATCKGAVDWKRYVELVGVPEARRGGDVNVSAPAAVAASCRLFGELDADVRKAYLKFHCVKSFSPHLSKVFVDAHFDFYSRKLSGQQEQQPRWKRCLGFVDAAMGELVAQVYVAKYFPESRKQRCLDLVERVRAQLEKRLKEVEWMASEAAPGPREDERLRLQDRLPGQINAYYHPNLNEIVFPAAILQPPFFDAEADDATNLGAMGVVVGHEMTHGFDDQGRQYDASGNLRDWWTADDAAEYEARPGHGRPGGDGEVEASPSTGA
ncbi:metalloendopeptidase [Aureococcus anophagefferens]|nr:metalloendopeptidase [Aureococcus anophagefferens]